MYANTEAWLFKYAVGTNLFRLGSTNPIFFELWSFCDVITPIFDEFFTITRKIKNGEFFYYFSHSIQHTSHHP